MSVVVILVLCSLLISGGFLLAFLWATKRGQYDDMHTPAMKILFDDRTPTQQP